MKSKNLSLDEELQQEYQQWEYLYHYGGQDPFREDGGNMNLVRNHIIHTKHKMEEANQLTETYYKELPLEVDCKYMARADEIRVNAKNSLEVYKHHEDYLYLLNAIKSLNKKQVEDTCIQNVIGYARGLEMYIERDELVGMRRHEKAERYTVSFTDCRKRVEQIIGNKPAVMFFEDKRQLKGQLSIMEWLVDG